MTRPIRRILVAVKDVRGRAAAPAIRKAAQLARALDARLELFHAITDPLAVDALMFSNQTMQQTQTAMRARYLKRLESFAKPLRRTGVDVQVAAEWDYPAHEALVRRARHTDADLIVAARHATKHVAPVFLRYTDWELVRQSPVPVLLVKNSRQYHLPRVLAAIDPSHALAKTARLDEEILRTGARIGAALRGRLHVVHAYVPALNDIDPTQWTAVDATARITGHAQEQARIRFDKALRASRLGELPAGRRHLVARHPVDAIPKVAREAGCDIVVMGAISRSGLRGLLIGNTAEQLLDDLPCDLLIVKPPSFATRVAAKSRGPQLVVIGPPAGVV